MSNMDLFDREIMSVGELTLRLKETIEAEFGLIWVVGEISNLSRPSSGHMYLTVKDERAQVRAVMFKTKQRYLDFIPADGQEVLIRGRLSIYEPRGEYQIVVDYMEPRGEGALRLAFEKLKSRLAEEGLFDEDKKKKLPFLPKRLALVTSPTGAAVRDFIRVARSLNENIGLSVYPVRVQGEGAAEEIAQAVTDLNRWGGFDVIVLTRGGGSLEDLWAFNEEVVARAVAASNIPVVSAVGHEVDFTIADFAADLRAPTPSAAAALILRDKKELKSYLAGMNRRLTAGLRSGLYLTRERLAHLATRLGDPERILAGPRLRLDDLTETMILSMKEKLAEDRTRVRQAQAGLAPAHPGLRLKVDRQRITVLGRDLARAGRTNLTRSREALASLAARLGGLSPLAVLSRGYALARTYMDLKSVRSSEDVSPGDRLKVLLGRGELGVTVDEVLK